MLKTWKILKLTGIVVTLRTTPFVWGFCFGRLTTGCLATFIRSSIFQTPVCSNGRENGWKCKLIQSISKMIIRNTSIFFRADKKEIEILQLSVSWWNLHDYVKSGTKLFWDLVNFALAYISLIHEWSSSIFNQLLPFIVTKCDDWQDRAFFECFLLYL